MEGQTQKRCQRCYNELPVGAMRCPDCDEWNVFNVTEASIQKIMQTLREMPKGGKHSWFMFAPNSDDSKKWSGFIIKAARPVLWTSLRSQRLKVPGDPLCGEIHVDKNFHDLRQAERYIRYWIVQLQKKWVGYPGPEEMSKRKREQMEYQWSHS